MACESNKNIKHHMYTTRKNIEYHKNKTKHD
jgi:hypothetical protein